MKFDKDNAESAIRVLFEVGQTVEVRVPDAGKFRTIRGYFNDPVKLCNALAEVSGDYNGIYWTINPCNDALLARAYNRLEMYAKETTSDADDNIVKRRWLLLDFDPKRPAGISATDSEKAEAKAMCSAVRKYLKQLGWADPVVCDSGNGYHLLFLIDLPNDDESRDLIKAVLQTLAAKFDTDTVKVDQKVFNSSRIIKAYGTVAGKGDSIPGRPHRIARMFEPPLIVDQVPKDKLEALAAEAPQSENKKSKTATMTAGPWTTELVEALLTHGGVEFKPAMTYKMGKPPKDGWKWQHACLNNPEEHKCPDAFTALDGDGWVSEKCSHNSCGNGLNSTELVDKIEEMAGSTFAGKPKPKKEKPILNFDDEEPDETSATPKPEKTWNELADILDDVRVPYELDEHGRKHPLPPHIVDEAVFQFVLKHLRKRAKFYVDAYPYVFIPAEETVYKFQGEEDPHKLLSRLRLRITQTDTKLVRENLSLHILMNGEPCRIEKYGCLRGAAVYVNNGRGGMFKITVDNIEEAPNGTDGVIMLCPELEPWPELTSETRVKLTDMDGLGGKLGDTPLCRHFNAYFEEGLRLTPVQYQQLFMLRYLSLFIGEAIALRPILLAIGEQNSGKSTLFEKPMWLLHGIEYESGAMPTNLRGFVSSITNHATRIFDNIDSINFNNPKSDFPQYIDLMCKCATGGTLGMAELYKTNVEKEFGLRCDIMCTARVNPFPSERSDLVRRTIIFPIRKPVDGEFRTVERMKRELAGDSTDMKLETLARLQGVLRALVTLGGKEYPAVSEMHSYETYTMRVADHEGWVDECKAIWLGLMDESKTQVSEDSPFVEWVRRWIGNRPTMNVGREIGVGKMYAELTKIYGDDFTRAIRNNKGFGKMLKLNLSALRVLGVSKRMLDGCVIYSFTPSTREVDECVAAFNNSARRVWVGDTEDLEDAVSSMTSG